VPLVIGQFLEPIDQNTGIVGSTTGSNYVVRILSTLDRELLKPSSSVALHRHSNALVDILPPEADSSIAMLGAHEKPDVTYSDVGGLDMQKQELREAVELPLTHGDLYRQIGIDPPRGVLLYGPPGTGKTMLVKAVANSTTASFIRVVGSEFVQKYLGEGPRMVRDVFRLARENSPSIIFIDEIDAIATKRFDAQTGADREVQRILLELLNQMDGFDQQSSVKVSPPLQFPDCRLSWRRIAQIPSTQHSSVPAVLTVKSSSPRRTTGDKKEPSTPPSQVKCLYPPKSISILLSCVRMQRRVRLSLR
jgi:26S proteasome regulatory subunit T3